MPGHLCPSMECALSGHRGFASTAAGTLAVRTCTCSYAWGTDELGHVTEVRTPTLGCPTHPAQHCPGCQCGRLA
jgi:hypothetical protein